MSFNRFSVLSITIVPLLLVGCGSTQTRSDAPDANTSSAMTSTEAVYAKGATLRVDGLGCPMCAESITVLMGNIEAVTESKVDLSTGTVHVDLNPSIAVSEAELRSAIDDGGFTFRSIAFEK